jgi:hypothetical protein
MVVNKNITIANGKKIVHAKDPHSRIRPFITLGPVKIENPELYDQFFLDIFSKHNPIWVTDLVLRAHAKLEKDSDKFKYDFVEPVLKKKKYLRSIIGPSLEVNKEVTAIKKCLDEVSKHVEGKIDSKFLAEKLHFLGNNFILLETTTRKKIGKELPNLIIEFNSNFGLDVSTAAFTSVDFATFSSSFGDMGFDSGFGDSGFDGFGGGDFGGGGGGDSW